MALRLVLADDHPIVLKGLEELFRLEEGFEVVARCRDGTQTLAAVRDFAPDVLVLDVRMPQPDGVEVLRILQEEGLGTRVVLLTATLAEDQLVEALRYGVSGIVLKETAPELLVEAVRVVHGGGEWLGQGIGGRTLRSLLDRQRALRPTVEALSPREVEIVRWVGNGLRNRAIAERLYITEGTVKVHLHNIYKKLGVTNRVELALHARSHGLV